MPTRQVILEHENKMKKAVEMLQENMRGLRTGAANTGLVENLRVDYYGTLTPLKQMAALACPQADSIIIKPFDVGALHEIEKAIKSSDLSIAPIIEGKMIRLNVPALSEDRRKQMVLQAKQLGEQTKVSLRNIRRDGIKQLEKDKEDSVITEDNLEEGKKELDNLTKEWTAKIDSLIKSKSDEIMKS